MAIHCERAPLTPPDEYTLEQTGGLPLCEIDEDLIYTMWTRDPRLLRVAGAAGKHAAALTIMIVGFNYRGYKPELEFEPFHLETKESLGIHTRVTDLDGIIYDDRHSECPDGLGYVVAARPHISVERGRVVERVPTLAYLPHPEAEMTQSPAAHPSQLIAA